MTPELYGLVLAGGRGQRMNQDKGSLVYAGEQQYVRCHRLLSNFCSQVYISCRQEQHHLIPRNYRCIFDQQEDTGPAGGLIAAYLFAPQVSWLVIACDLPLLDTVTLEYLCQERCKDSYATLFVQPQTGDIEPMVAIWEAKGLQLFTSCLQQYHHSPQQFFRQNNCKLVNIKDKQKLSNANTPSEHMRLSALIANS